MLVNTTVWMPAPSDEQRGGAVAQALLADGEFAVRAVTRDAASGKAQVLAGLGAHVVDDRHPDYILAAYLASGR